MSAKEVLRVIYAPHKAFKEIIQKPGYKGPIIIMGLFVLSFAIFYYVLSSRVYYDQTAPQLSSTEFDKWTEDATLWSLSAAVSENSTDYIKGSYYGNKSIQFHLENETQISMELKIPTSLNCLGADGYANVSFRVKIVEPETNPYNLSIYLFSANTTDNYFYHSIADGIAETGIWNNKTILLSEFTKVNNADWSNITGLKLELAWTSNENITVLVDGLFFHGVYKSALEINGSGILVNSVISGFMQFTIQWTILGIFLYLLSKLFKAQPIWKSMLTISGFALITFFLQNLIITGVVLAYPETHFSLSTLGGVSGEGFTVDAQNFQSILMIRYDILDRIVYYVWIVALCTIALHLMFAFSWTRSISISILSSLISMLIFRLIIYGTVWL
ncbi:MAG: hypothetical protein QHH18_04280 [Candidatus Bathyarchaeota archaeon]|jgi:hypothetical protein|nr:hypothetical protein [Candidatus Bathyarchaeota archaeon A05DMB-5]MDH7557806.1 hypothetical protein [Candidatus Bathyarchaeota archaeon]